MSRERRAALYALITGLLLAALACDDLVADASPRRRRRRARTAPPATAPYAPAAPVAPPSATAPTTAIAPGTVRLRVTFLDVGQGDAALLETADGHAAMIDTGPPEARDRVRAALASHGIARLDWLMLSHPHLDHIGSATTVLESVPVGRVVDPAYPHPIATYDRLLARIQQLGLPFTAARSRGMLPLGALASVEVLQPHEPFIEHSRSDVNANSIVARVTAGNVRVLFTGDAERETEARLLGENAAQLAANVLKVAHHGSRYASSPALLAAVAPRYAVISCATGNDYGHPHAETLGALAQRGITFFRTDVHGDVTLLTDGAQLAFSTARTASPTELMTPGEPRGGREE